MNQCPFCHNPVEEGISYCPFCDKALGPSSAKKVKWYQRTGSLIFGFLMVGPFVLPAVWLNPHYSRKKKFVVTFLCLYVTYLITKVFVKSVHSILDHYSQAFQIY